MLKNVAWALVLLIVLSASPSAGASAAQGWEQWLPELNREYTYFGLAEYGHKGRLMQLWRNGREAVYEFRGVFSDGIGDESRFVVRYAVDIPRGTVTEQAVSNERGKPEVNSRLHNLVVLKFPLSLGECWSHTATLNGSKATVQAEVTEYSETAGVVKVRYTASPAPGYYGNTYFETRTYEKGYGMTAFANLMPGDIGLSAGGATDAQTREVLDQHMFGYCLNKALAAEPMPAPSPDTVSEIKALLPPKAGYSWHYEGFAEYGATLSLTSISDEGGVPTYRAEGDVADMSGGASGSDYSIQVTYQVLPGILRQHLVSGKAMDKTLPNLDLIRAPLVLGNAWTQTVTNDSGVSVTLSCQITGIRLEGGHTVYSVKYQAEGDAYYETRDITEGMGVTAFNKLYTYIGGSEMIGYHIS